MKKKKEASVPAKKKNKKKVARRVAKKSGNEFSSILQALQTKTQPIPKNKPANTYVATVSFSADRRLTPEEIDRLTSAVSAQVEDPAGLGDEKRADFSTSDVATRIKRTREINRRKRK